MTDFPALIAAQEALILALDSADAEKIEHATTHMAAVMEVMRRDGFDSRDLTAGQLDAARTQNVEAAKRVNSLTNWTASKLERVNELRGRGTLGRPISY